MDRAENQVGHWGSERTDEKENISKHLYVCNSNLLGI